MSLPPALRRTLALVVIVGLSGCQLAELPTAPSDLTQGVSIYEDANFLGESALLEADSRDLSDFKGPCEHAESDSNGATTYTYNWNDCTSSLRLAPGWRAIVYRDTNYRGQSMELTADAPNLQLVAGTCSHDGLNDCISSIKVIAPGSAF